MDAKTRLFVEENANGVYASYRGGQHINADERWCLHQAYRLIEEIDAKPRSAELVGRILKLSASTVFEYAGALQAGGVPIVRTNGLPTGGRPMTIFSLGR